MQDINTSLTKMKNDIHDLSDLITESTTNATTAHQELKTYIDGIKTDITGENTTFKGEVTAELNSQKQFLKDSIDGFKNEYTASTNDSI
jgi:predicted DNA-binding ArsR family transcriptional regulator